VHLCYLDESGTSQIPGNTSHYVLAGIAIPATQWKFCDNAIQIIKRKYKLEKAEIHTAWLLRPYLEQKKIPTFQSLNYSDRRLAVNKFRKKELLRLQRSKPKIYRQVKKNFTKTQDYIHLTYKQRKNLVFKLSEMVGNWNFSRLFAECVDKIYFDPSVHGTSADEQSFEQVVSRFEQYLQITSAPDNPNMGMLIHDNNPTVARKLTNIMIRFHDAGTLWTKVKNIIETPLFVDSKLTAMVQIADLCSYALRRYLENDETTLFNNIYSRADRKDGRVVGVRHFSDRTCACLICQSR
jgi:hypothetical protein